EAGKYSLPLFARPSFDDEFRAHAVVVVDRAEERPVGPTELLDNGQVLGKWKLSATVFTWKCDAEEAGFAELLEDRFWDLPEFFYLVLVWEEFFAYEPSCRLADLVQCRCHQLPLLSPLRNRWGLPAMI